MANTINWSAWSNVQNFLVWLLNMKLYIKGIDTMKESRLQLIKSLAARIKAENSRKFKSLERQAIQLSDREYVTTDKKSVDSVEVLDFN